jgi:peptidoglycan/LPS O-acetylase OafA/YrhL
MQRSVALARLERAACLVSGFALARCGPERTGSAFARHAALLQPLAQGRWRAAAASATPPAIDDTSARPPAGAPRASARDLPGQASVMSMGKRYRSLDAIRGIAAFGVVLFHYRNHFGAAPYAKALEPVYQRGMIFVDVFFVMSGYLLVTIYAGRRDFWALAWRRVARLAPLHWLMLALVTILQHLMVRRYGVPFTYAQNDAYHFLLNLLLLQSTGLANGFSFDGPSWSISVEWLINLLLFALLAAGIRRLTLAACSLALLSALAMWHHGKSMLAGGLFGGYVDVALLRGSTGFFAGVALSRLVPLAAEPRAPAPAAWERAAGHLWDLVLVLSVVALTIFMASNPVAGRPGVDFSVVLVVIPALIAGAVHGRWAARALALRPLQWLGRVSYSLYLVHFPMQALFVLLFPHPERWLDYARPSVLAAYLAATLLTSHLTLRFVELPAQSLLQRLSIRRQAPAPSA